MKAETREQSLDCSALAGDVPIKPLKVFTALHVSLSDPRSAGSIHVGITNTFWRVGKFANRESADNEYGLYLLNKVNQ